ncbi:MAG TPA: hypothetical protein VFE59_16060 [Trebonia sp.]|jgi:hypothetical protein|nr:hypothetical protein [Trebonia sp.]
MMAETLATKTSLPGYERPGTFEAVQAGALFASTLQPSGSPSRRQIRRAVAATLERLGVCGCAERVAGEFGDHPDTAVARMSWALAMIRTVYPVPVAPPVPDLRPLAFAS